MEGTRGGEGRGRERGQNVFLNGRSLSVSGLWHFTSLKQTLLAEALKL